jgi:hypothetical protein
MKNPGVVDTQSIGHKVAAGGSNEKSLGQIEGDKHGSIDVKGIPTCTSGELQSRTSKAAREVCGKALIGSGKTDVEIKFPEQVPILAHSELLAFNGGVKGGVTTFFVHAYLSP